MNERVAEQEPGQRLDQARAERVASALNRLCRWLFAPLVAGALFYVLVATNGRTQTVGLERGEIVYLECLRAGGLAVGLLILAAQAVRWGCEWYAGYVQRSL